MSKKLKQYRLCGVRFVHDSRGTFVRDGEIAWLDDDKAKKILSALKRDGRPDALALVSDEKKKRKKVSEPEPVKDDSTATESAGEGEPISVGEPSPPLGLHFSIRKKAASAIVGVEIKSTPEADEILSSSPADVVENALKAIEAEEA
jgi:hypothetical protein